MWKRGLNVMHSYLDVLFHIDIVFQENSNILESGIHFVNEFSNGRDMGIPAWDFSHPVRQARFKRRYGVILGRTCDVWMWRNTKRGRGGISDTLSVRRGPEIGAGSFKVLCGSSNGIDISGPVKGWCQVVPVSFGGLRQTLRDNSLENMTDSNIWRVECINNCPIYFFGCLQMFHLLSPVLSPG